MRIGVPDDVTLAQGLVLFRQTYPDPSDNIQPEDVSPVVRWLENPRHKISPLGRELFPGRTTLAHHDYLHVLCDATGASEGEALVIGATMGSTGKMTKTSSSAYLGIINFFAPKVYRYSRDARGVFYRAVDISMRLARRGLLRDMSRFDFSAHTSTPVGYLRREFGIPRLMNEFGTLPPEALLMDRTRNAVIRWIKYVLTTSDDRNKEHGLSFIR